MNDIYAYFDYHGTLKERVSAPIRANSTQVNSIYAYWDNQSVEPVTYSVTWRLVGSDSLETTSEHYAETLSIPANYLGRRDLVFFKEAKLYNFIRFPVPSAVTAVAGTYVATIRYALSTQATFVLGSLTFEVEGDRGIALGESLTLDQYNYLLEQYSEVYDWATLRFLPLTGGTITGDLAVTRTIRANGNLAAKGYWLSTPDQVIIKLDNTVGDTGELQFGIPSGDYSPAFYGSLGVKMWDGRQKTYPSVKFNYYDANDEYESTDEEQIATQQWSDARYLKLVGGTVTGPVTFNSPVTSYGYFTLQSGMTVSGLEIHGGNEDHAGNATFQKNITISAAAPTEAYHATRKDYVDGLVASVKSNAFQVVQALPQTGEEGVIYLVPVQGEDYYTQYIWEGSGWLDIGDTNVHLSGYLPLTGGTIDGDLNVGSGLTHVNISGENGSINARYSGSRVSRAIDLDTSTAKIVLTLSALGAEDYITTYSSRGIKTSDMGDYEIRFPTDEDFSDEQNHTFATREWVEENNASDVVDNLTSTATNKPLSANQGRILNDSISELKDLLYEISVSEATYTATSDVFAIPQAIDSNRVLVSPGCVLSKLKGNTASFNQLIKDSGNHPSHQSWTIDNSAGSSAMYGTQFFECADGYRLTLGHKYLIWFVGSKTITGTGNAKLYCNVANNQGNVFDFRDGYAVVEITTINYPTSNVNLLTQIGAGVSLTIDGYICFTDLTITGDESLTLDQLKAKYNKYFSYNAGTLYSPIVSKVESWGANIWDEEWEVGTFDVTTGEPTVNINAIRTKNLISVKPSTAYFCYIGVNYRDIWCYFYDSDGNLIQGVGTSAYPNIVKINNLSFVTPSNCRYIKFYVSSYGNVYNHDICINLSSWFNGTYKPYVGQLGSITFPSAPITLRGVNASQDEIVFVEDGVGTYTAKLVRNRAVADLSARSWTYQSANNRWYASSSGLDMKGVANTALPNIACDKYEVKTFADANDSGSGFCISSGTNPSIFLYTTDSATTPSGNIDYELATPTEEILATGLTYEQVSMLFEEGGYMQVENANSDYTHADTELAFAVKRAD